MDSKSLLNSDNDNNFIVDKDTTIVIENNNVQCADGDDSSIFTCNENIKVSIKEVDIKLHQQYIYLKYTDNESEEFDFEKFNY